MKICSDGLSEKTISRTEIKFLCIGDDMIRAESAKI